VVALQRTHQQTQRARGEVPTPLTTAGGPAEGARVPWRAVTLVLLALVVTFRTARRSRRTVTRRTEGARGA
jgi:hypothetical protein